MLRTALLLIFLSAPAWPSAAQDTVTVPKSRLEELERKEKELERLKGEQDKAKDQKQDKTKDETLPPKKENEKTEVRTVLAPPPEPLPYYASPALASLPALQPYDTIESMDLANYYHADREAADRRFRKQKVTIRGEIVGFEKPLWNRTYRILLKSPTRETKVICDLLPPDKSNAVFTTNHGDELVALFGETRMPIAKVGQIAVVKGECKGRSDTEVTILGWNLRLEK